MEFQDARRLTGPSFLSLRPLVVVELGCAPGDEADRAVALYREELARMRAALGLASEIEPVVFRHAKGVVVGYEAPIDVMLAHAEASEWAGMSAAERSLGRAALALEPKRTEIAEMLRAQARPRLLALAEEARRRSLPFSWDDELVSVGAGARSRSFSPSALPAPEEVDWASLGAVPVALVTGTNGKTTSSRLLSRVMREAGRAVGNTSTDGVVIGDETVERGDWTGPAAARLVLRDPRTELAVLETARGGILRRGLAVDSADVALITNVSDDHLGGYGIDDLDTMTRVKGVVAEIVPERGVVVLNAKDPHLHALASRVAARVVFFADLDAGDAETRARIERHVAAGGEVVVAEGDRVVVRGPGGARVVTGVSSLPITFGGAARFNVENVLGVVAAAIALGARDDAVARALVGFRVSDNPHRGQLHERHGVRVLLDFGHNPEAVRAVLRLVAALIEARPGRLFVVTGSAGDRSDDEIVAVAQAIAAAGPERVLVRELHAYLRGRAVGDVPRLFGEAFERAGIGAERFAVVESEVAALESLFREARPGDVIAVLVHVDRDPVRAFLASE
jgi:UDP-N-acetylmuramyl tripeptide synthase